MSSLNLDQIRKRVDWAKYQRDLLERSVKNYSKKYPIKFRYSVEEGDRRSWEMRLVLLKEPPLDRWAFKHADIVHNLRGCLDNAVWLLSHRLKGDKIRNISDIGFPVVFEKEKWNNTRNSNSVENLTPKLARYIESVQPFNFTSSDESRIPAFLEVLHKVDIQNKHHKPVVAGSSEQVRLYTPGIEYETKIENQNEQDIRVYNPLLFKNDYKVMEQKTQYPIKHLLLDTENQKVFESFYVIDTEVGKLPLIGILDEFFNAVNEIIAGLERNI